MVIIQSTEKCLKNTILAELQQTWLLFCWIFLIEEVITIFSIHRIEKGLYMKI